MKADAQNTAISTESEIEIIGKILQHLKPVPIDVRIRILAYVHSWSHDPKTQSAAPVPSTTI